MDRKFTTVFMLALAVMAVAIAGCTGADETVPVVEKVTTIDVKYIVGIDGEYPPYSYIDKDGNPTGFDVESIKWIADKKGFDVEIKPMAWDGIIPALQAGKIDMVYSGMTITDDRLEKVNFSKPYWVANQAVAVRADSEITLDDYKAGKVVCGAQRGSTAAEWIETNLIKTELMPEDNLKLYDNFPLAVSDLENKRIDAAMYDTPVVKDIIAEKDDVVMLGTIQTDEEYGIAVRKDDVRLLNTLNDGLDMLMADPYWKELIEKYKLA
jgi:polar amino acid transport system substrate-binding protein